MFNYKLIIMEKYHMLNRPDREILVDSNINKMLYAGKYIVISMCSNNEPYIVTLSYGYDMDSNALYFH